jgi:hypothetical protein
MMSPVAVSSIATLTPLGNLNPPGHVFPTEHQYMYLPLGEAGLTEVVHIVAPGHLFLVEVASSEHVGAGFTDYDLTLAPCDGVSFRFGHVATLDPALAATIGAPAGGDCETYETGGETYHRCRQAVRVELQPGTPIGTAGGNPGQYALDIGTRDTRKPPAPYANPAGYEPFLYSSCFLDYTDAGLRADLLTKVERTAEPRCGTHAQDVAGTAQGNWRREGSPTFPEDPHLALVHDMIQPTAVRLSIGTSLAAASGVWSPTTTGTGRANRDPQDVTADGGAWCWDLGTRRLVVGMPTASTLRAEVQDGACGVDPWTLGTLAVDFAR